MSSSTASNPHFLNCLNKRVSLFVKGETNNTVLMLNLIALEIMREKTRQLNWSSHKLKPAGMGRLPHIKFPGGWGVAKGPAVSLPPIRGYPNSEPESVR